MEKFIQENTNKTLKQLAGLWPEKVSGWRLGRWIKRLGYTYKKPFFHTERNELEVKEFMEQINQIPLERWVYLDESGDDNNITFTYSYSLRGKRCYGKRNLGIESG